MILINGKKDQITLIVLNNLLFLIHIFLESKHLVRPFVVFGTFVVQRIETFVFMRVAVVFAEEFDSGKAEFVDVEVDIPLLEIRRTGLPHDGIRVKALDLLPRGGSDAFAVNVGRYEQDLKLIVLRHLVYLQNKPADDPAILTDAVGDAVVDAVFDCLAGDDLAVAVKMVVALTELFDGSVFEGVLIVEYELFAIFFCKVCKGDV